jgi:hypothetical protein
LVTVSFITSGLNVYMLYWCFSYGIDDGILNVGWLHWKQLLKIQVQSDQQESKSEQALQIIGHVVAESYANKRSKHGRRQFVVSNASL